MEVRIIPAVDLAPLDDLLLEEGHLRLHDARELSKIPQLHLVAWCQARGRYHVPSRELVDWLRELIGDRCLPPYGDHDAIEIGAGMGDLGRRLGIPMTDSYVQVKDPSVRRYYDALGVPPVQPPADVECLEALEAVRKYKPRVVIAAWVTQLYLPGDETPPKIGSSLFGVDELALFNEVETYVHIGNLKVHGDKRLLRKPHQEHRLPFLFSRGFEPDKNIVYVWGPR